MERMRPLIFSLVGALAVLIAISQFTTSKRLETAEDGGFADVLGKSVDTGTIHDIKAWVGFAPDTVVHLSRKGDGWIVASAWDWPADQNKVDQLLNGISDLKGERRSADTSVLEDYAIDEENGLHLTGLTSGGGEVFHLVVGKNSRSGGNFVRRAGSDVVYTTRESMRSNFGLWSEEPKTPESKGWLDLELFRTDRLGIDKVSLTTEGKSLVLTKTFEEQPPDSNGVVPPPNRNVWAWEASDGDDVYKPKADNVVGALAAIRAAEAVDPTQIEAYGLGEGARIAEITLEDGTVHTFRFGDVSDEDESRVYVMVEEGRPALIYKSIVDRIFVSRSDLRPPAES